MGAGVAQGQVAWESPMLMAPEQPAGFGVYLVDPDPSNGVGALATWRSSGTPGSLGFRVGLAEGYRGEVAGYGGVDVSSILHRGGPTFPLDIVVAAGVGAGVGEYLLVTVPLGLTFGRALDLDNARFIPYTTPRLVLDAHFGSDRPRRGVDLGFAVDLGVDVAFDPAWTIRFGATLGRRSALAIGLAFPM